MKLSHRILIQTLVTALLCAACFAQWNPHSGQWGKSHGSDIRIMTWNVKDALCSSNSKTEAINDWTGMVVIVAAMKPDILLLQETADNTGNGTGSGMDSISNLETTIDLFFHGGKDPFNGNVDVTAYVQKYAPGYDLPHIFVSGKNDGYNRNVIMSRFPFTDLNGDTKSVLSDIPYILPDEYAPGGTGGIRGFQWAEINLPNFKYAGDLAVGNAHLKSGSGTQDKEDRLKASKNIAYYIEYLFNGAGTGLPDPNGKIIDNPEATHILGPDTPVVIGGDWNEDENKNGRDGPALWMRRAEFYETAEDDGTDKDMSDSEYDAAAHPISGNTTTLGSSKLDYLAWQDSTAQLRRAFIYDSSGLQNSQQPPEVLNFPYPSYASGAASDHLPVIGDFRFPVVNYDARWMPGMGAMMRPDPATIPNLSPPPPP